MWYNTGKKWNIIKSVMRNQKRMPKRSRGKQKGVGDNGLGKKAKRRHAGDKEERKPGAGMTGSNWTNSKFIRERNKVFRSTGLSECYTFVLFSPEVKLGPHRLGLASAIRIQRTVSPPSPSTSTSPSLCPPSSGRCSKASTSTHYLQQKKVDGHTFFTQVVRGDDGSYEISDRCFTQRPDVAGVAASHGVGRGDIDSTESFHAIWNFLWSSPPPAVPVSDWAGVVFGRSAATAAAAKSVADGTGWEMVEVEWNRQVYEKSD